MERATANCLVRSQSLNSIKSSRRFSRKSSSYKLRQISKMDIYLSFPCSYVFFTYFGQLLIFTTFQPTLVNFLHSMILTSMLALSSFFKSSCFWAKRFIIVYCYPNIPTCTEGNFCLSIAGKVNGSGVLVRSLVRQPSKNRSLSILAFVLVSVRQKRKTKMVLL